MTRSILRFARSLPALSLLATGAANAQNIIQLPDSIWAAGDTITWVKRVPAYCEGAAWDPATATAFFTRQLTNQTAHWPVYRIKPGVDTGSVFIDTSYQANGIEFDPQGRMVIVQNGRVSRYKPNGTLDTTLVLSGNNGVTFGQANDLSFASTGAFYFTDLGTKIYHVNAAGQLSLAYTGASSANGIEWIEESGFVYVNENSNVRKYTVGAGGALSSPVNFASASGIGADGGAVDAHGNRYVANYNGGEIRVFNNAGDSIGRIALRMVSGAYNNRSGNAGNVSNAAFGGPDRKTLYISGDGGLFSIPLKIPGRLRPGTTALRPSAGLKIRPELKTERRDARGRLLAPEAPAKTGALKVPVSTGR